MESWILRPHHPGEEAAIQRPKELHEFLFKKDKHTQQLNHTHFAHGMVHPSTFHVQEEHRDRFGTGQEPHLRWNYFLHRFMQNHGIPEEHLPQLQQTVMQEVFGSPFYLSNVSVGNLTNRMSGLAEVHQVEGNW